MSIDSEGWLSTNDAAAKLGVRPQTLYAYVSRGLLNPRREGRKSLFSVDELDKLEPRGKRALRAGRIEVAIDSAVTLLESEGRLFYRGQDVEVIAPPGASSEQRSCCGRVGILASPSRGPSPLILTCRDAP